MDEQPELPGQRIRRRRFDQKLSRHALAEVAGLDTATVRRIEHGAYARCEEALAIARALNVSADELFAGVFTRLKQFPSNAELTDTAWNDMEFRKELAEYGVDIHPAVWFLKLHFRSGGEQTFVISAPDLDRFQNALADEGNEHPKFVVFDSTEKTVAVNLSEVVHAHLMFEGVGGTVTSQEGPQTIEVTLVGEKEPLTFGSELDVSENLDDPGADHGQLHTLLEHIEGAGEHKPFATFFDEDGEQVLLRVNAVALVTVSHVLLWGAYDEDRDGAPEPSSPSRRPQLKVLEGGR